MFSPLEGLDGGTIIADGTKAQHIAAIDEALQREGAVAERSVTRSWAVHDRTADWPLRAFALEIYARIDEKKRQSPTAPAG